MANSQKAQGRFGARKELKIQNQNIDDPGGFDNLILRSRLYHALKDIPIAKSKHALPSQV